MTADQIIRALYVAVIGALMGIHYPLLGGLVVYVVIVTVINIFGLAFGSDTR